MKQQTAAEFLALFDPSVHAAIIKKAAMPSVEAVVCFECVDFCSSNFGRRTAVIVGEPYTFKSVAFCEGKWLNDLPSQRQYPQSWVRASELINAQQPKESESCGACQTSNQ